MAVIEQCDFGLGTFAVDLEAVIAGGEVGFTQRQRVSTNGLAGECR